MAGFAEGLRSGVSLYGTYQRGKRDQEEYAMAKERHAREMERSDLQLDEARRTARTNRQLDEETAGIRSYLNNGTMTGNKSGYSDESAGLLFRQGGASAVDEAASYGNVEARRMGLDTPYQTGGVSARQYDPANPDDQIGLNRRMMNVAATKGDYTALQSLQDKNREVGEVKIFNEAVKQFLVNPDSFTEYTRWINSTNPAVSSAPARDPKTGQLTGYNIMTVGPSGDATHKFISPQQAATLAGATALMQVNPAKALQLIGTVDTALAASIQQQNQTQANVTTTGNTAMHYANQDGTSRMNAESSRITANATASRASQERKTPGEQAQEKIEMYSGILMRQNPKLSKEEAEKKAADIILRDPNAKDNDAGLAEAGIVKIQGKYFRQGKTGLEPVKMPGQDATTAALEALAKSGKDPFAPSDKGGKASRTQPVASPAKNSRAPARPEETMVVLLEQEDREIARGTRRQYSPQLRQLLQQSNAARSADEASYLEREKQRAKSRSANLGIMGPVAR